MARGQRTNLADLVASTGDQSPVERSTTRTEDALRQAAALLDDLTPNPHNPRDSLGDLADLASIADIQLQPAVVVTQKAYQGLYPDDVISTRYVVINGCRRLAAAHKYGRTDLAIVVNDDIARDRITLISASIAENVDRQDFDVIEEARAVESLVAECGRAEEAAIRLHKTEGWVSQRRALLQLAPELQAALRRGELALREARTLARVPQWEQVARWQAAQDKRDKTKDQSQTDKRPQAPSRIVAKALREFDHNPVALADALHGYLGDRGLETLVTLLAERAGAVTASVNY
ncbi:ParB/RepB/Spo0J family partition protein [Mycobacterium sp. URHB0021]